MGPAMKSLAWVALLAACSGGHDAPVTDGPAAGQSINYFRAPFGTYVELISYPGGMAYESDPSRPLWSPQRNGLDSVATSARGAARVEPNPRVTGERDMSASLRREERRCQTRGDGAAPARV